MSSKTATQELSDTFYALQIVVKILDGITTEYENGSRTQEDYERRFHSQVGVLCKGLGEVRPLAEKIISDGYSKYAKGSEHLISDSNLHGTISDGVVGDEGVSAE
jgi:hypothetical protein